MSVKIAVNLKNRGFSVQTTLEAGNLGATDEQQLRYAANGNRIFVTHNIKDFLALHNNYLSAGKAHAGIVLALRRRDPNAMVLRLLQLLQDTTAREMQNQIRYL